MSHFDFNPTFLLTVLTDKYLMVPRYQRSYAWGEDQVSDFWEDMAKSINDKTEYFLGTIVLSEESGAGTWSIIDGQQRLATTTILLAVIRNTFNSHGRKEVADAIQQQYLAPFDVTTLSGRPRLRLNTTDNQFYISELIANDEAGPLQVDSHRLIRSAKTFIEGKIASVVAENPKAWPKRLTEITSYLKSQARVVVVTAPTNADAFTIFETLNDRGADLTISDLLKNYLFSMSGGELDFVQDAWMEAVSILNLYQENREFVNFLRHLWSSIHGATRERDLYKSIKGKISGKAAAVSFSTSLLEAAKLYGAILSAESEVWKKFPKVSRAHVETLTQLDLEQNRPLLLAVLQHFTPAEAANTLRSLVSWSIRGIVAGSIGGGKAEKYFCDAAVDIRSGKIKGVKELISKLSPIVPNDTAFRQDFSTFRTTSGPLSRYILFTLERDRRKDKEPELVLNTNVDEINLEHLLPRNPKPGEWPTFSAEEAAVFCYRVGNMTVMKKAENNRIGNKSWAVKRTALAKSSLRLNKDLASEKKWEKEQIVERQGKFADRAVQIWSL